MLRGDLTSGSDSGVRGLRPAVRGELSAFRAWSHAGLTASSNPSAAPLVVSPRSARQGCPMVARDRDDAGRPRQARPRDELGRPLPYGATGVEPVSEDPLPPREAARFALELLDQGRPFSAHEVFEARWKAAPEVEHDLWQGLAQLCVGLTHARRGNQTGARRLLERGDTRVGRYIASGGPSYGLDLAELQTWIHRSAGAHDGSSG